MTSERPEMKNEPKTRKGFFGMLRESFSRTGGCCCGPGETCGEPAKEGEERPKEEPGKTSKAAPK